MRRLLSIDFLRGFVVLLMTIDHTRYLFSTVAISTPMGTELPASYFFVRWFTHFCAPTFAFLAGLSMALRPMTSQPGADKALQQTLLKRGLFLLIPTAIVSIGWNTIGGWSGEGFTLHFGELWAIGGGMVFVALVMNFKPWIIGILSLVLVAGHHAFEALDNSGSILWSLLHVKQKYIVLENYLNINVSYPLLPWFGIVGLGYVIGCHFFREGAQFAGKRKDMLQMIAIGCLVIFVMLRYTNWYGDPNAFVVSSTSMMETLLSFIDVTKYPTSLLFVLLTLPLSCIVLSFTDSKFFQMPNKAVILISQYGQAALFYYTIHIFIILFYGAIISHLFYSGDMMAIKSDGLELTFIMTALVILTAYPLIRLFTRLRHQHKEKYPILAYF
jgi:uncharacterized membrane protein